MPLDLEVCAIESNHVNIEFSFLYIHLNIEMIFSDVNVVLGTKFSSRSSEIIENATILNSFD